MLNKILALIICCAMLLTFTGCSNNSVATVDGEDVEKGYFEYYFTQLKAQLQNELGEQEWETLQYEGKPALEYVRERALQSAVEDKIVMQKADEDNILLTNEDIKNMSAIKAQWINSYGSESAFVDELKNYGVTEGQFDYMLEAVCYRNHLVDKYVDVEEAEVSDYYKNEVAKVKHILISTVDLTTGTSLSEEEIAQAKEEVEYIQGLIANGTDFDNLVSEFTEDQDVFYYVGNGYTLSSDGNQYSAMISEFEEASLNLGVGEISEVIETMYGYHIIKRYENDEEMYEISKETLTLMLKTELFTDVINSWKTEKKIIVNESLYNSYK